MRRCCHPFRAEHPIEHRGIDSFAPDGCCVTSHGRCPSLSLSGERSPHEQMCRNATVNYLAGLSLDGIGVSSFMWKQQHVAGHHLYTNVLGNDPDIEGPSSEATGPSCRLVEPQPWAPAHVYQHVYLWFLYSLLALHSIFVADFTALAAGRIEMVRLAPMLQHEKAAFWGGKAAFAAWFFALPAAFSHWGWPQLLSLWLTTLGVGGWFLAIMFAVRTPLSRCAVPPACCASRLTTPFLRLVTSSLQRCGLC